MKRTTLYLDEKLIDEVKKIAESQKRSVSYMVSVLLQYAIKEKQRKKKDNPRNITSNVGSGNG